jgi:hypothetical protein
MKHLLCHKGHKPANHASSYRDDVWEILSQQMGHRSTSTMEHYLSKPQIMDDDPARVRMAMKVAAYTGMRLGEALSLRMEEADDFLRAVEVGVCPHGRNNPKAFEGADPEHFECESCRHMVVGDLLARQDDGSTPAPLPPVSGLTCQYHDLDQATALRAHLDALDEQLASRPRR